MFNSQTRQRVSWIILLTGLALVIYYFGVYRWLSRTVKGLDEPLVNSWNRLQITNQETKIVEVLNTADVRKGLQQVREHGQTLEKIRETLRSRVEINQDYLERLWQPFQLIDFQNERQARIEALSRQAKEKQVNIDPFLYTAIPWYPVGQQPANMVWPQLDIVSHILAAAIECKVTQVKSINLLPIESRKPYTNQIPGFVEIPVQIELLGPMSSVHKFLSILPLLSEEAKKAGLPAVSTNKPALFIGSLVLTKSSTEKPDEVTLNSVVSGFVLQTNSTRIELLGPLN